MKKLISVLLSASLILGLASCGNAKNTKRTRDRDEEDPTTAAAYKVEKGDETILTTGTVPATFFLTSHFRRRTGTAIHTTSASSLPECLQW